MADLEKQPHLDPQPGQGLLGWLGRQVGHVRNAIRTQVDGQVLLRHRQVKQKPHPTRPLLLRRTIIDEVVRRKPVEKNSTSEEKAD